MGRPSALVRRWPRLIYGVLPLAVVGVILALGARPATPVRPHLSRQSVIEAALEGSDRKAFPRVEAKLMYRRDLQRADSESGGGNRDELI